MPMSHRKAVWVMVAAALMWSIAGVVSRHLEAARGFEVTFWRSGFNALALVVLLSWLKGPGPLWAALRGGGSDGGTHLLHVRSQILRTD